MTDRHKDQDPNTLSDHAKKSLGAYKWNLYDQTLSQILNFGFNILLLRLLSPEEFGIFVIPFAIVSFIVLIQDFGYSSLIVYEKRLSPMLISSIFWTNLLTSALIFTAIQLYLLSGLSSSIDPVMHQTIFWLSFGVPLSAMYYVPEALLRKKMSFRSLFLVGVVAIFVSGIVGVLTAYAGWGVQSLTIKYVSYLSILAIGYLFAANWRPSLAFSLQTLRPHISYHLPLSAEQALNFIHRNIDSVLISKFLNTFQAGLYDRAYRILMFPIQQISGSFSKVMLPSLSPINQHPEKVGNYYFLICRLIMCLMLPIMTIFYFQAETFIQVIFGDGWMDIVKIAQIFGIIAIFQSLGTLSGSIYQAMGVTSLMLKLGILLKLNSIFAIVLGIFYFKSIEGVAICYAIASIINSFPNFYFTSKIVGKNIADFFRNISPFFWATVPLVFMQIGINHVVEQSFYRLILSVVLSGVTYFAILYLFFRKRIDEIKLLLNQWMHTK